MFLRLVQAKSKPDKTDDLRAVYDSAIIPTLQQTPGCLFACLIRGVEHPDDVASLTLWETQEDAEAYTKAGTFEALMAKVRPFLAAAAEMKMHLSADLKLEYSREMEEPEVTEYPVSIDLPTKQKGLPPTPSLYLRVLSVALKPEHRDEYYTLYIQKIIPALQEADGCLHTYLIMPSKGKKDSLSVTVWESKHHADTYEQGGQFARLISTVKHTFTDLIQWKLELDPRKRPASAIGDEIGIQGYSVLTLKDFGSTL